MKDRLMKCFSAQCLAAHANNPNWVNEVVAHMERHPLLPEQYMVQVLKDYGLLCRTTTWKDCAFVFKIRTEWQHQRDL